MLRALGGLADRVPVSSTKSVHGHALEASGLLEFAITLLSLTEGKLGVNAGYLGADPECRLNLIIDGPAQLNQRYALTVNSAFGGANTALILSSTDGIPPVRDGQDVQPQVVREARWLLAEDGEPPVVPGFIHSRFSPLVSAVADRVLTEHYLDPSSADGNRERTAILLVSQAGDQVSADQVSQIVAAGKRPGPLFFFQSVPNSIAGHVSAHWGLGGPVICLSPTTDPLAEGLDEAALLLSDGDADEVLLVLVEEPGAHGLMITKQAAKKGETVSEDRSEGRARTGAIGGTVSEDRSEGRARTGAIGGPA